MKKIRQSVLLLFVIITSLAFNLSGQQKVIPPDKSDRTSSSNRDIIKYLARVELGLAYGEYTYTHPSYEFIFSGLAVPMDVQLGIGIFPRTYIHGDFGVTILNRPTYTLNGIDATYEATVAMFDVGLGCTAYLIPQSVYLSAALYGTTMTTFIDEEVYKSEIGVAFKLRGGIDFMVGSSFSFGTSAFIYYAGMKDEPDLEGYKAQINNLVIGICLTATLGNL